MMYAGSLRGNSRFFPILHLFRRSAETGKFMNNLRFRSFANIVKGKNLGTEKKKTMQNKCIATQRSLSDFNHDVNVK